VLIFTRDVAVQAYASLNWVLTQEPLDVETELALGFLDYLLLGTPAAPLRKALNDSGLGAALVGGGIDDELKQPIFSVGLKVRWLSFFVFVGRTRMQLWVLS
jgi:Zn-dependent M16 (insulinase) family peptidase